MDRIRELINKRKLEAKFQRAGKGHKLAAPSAAALPDRSNETASSTRGASDVRRLAAEAAMKRSEDDCKRPQVSRTRRAVIEEARRQLAALSADDSRKEPAETDKAKTGAMASNFGIYFTCDLFGDDVFMPKKELVQAIEDHLRGCLAEEPLLISSLMVKSLNTFEQCENGVNILCRYLDNLINNPSEEKFRSIRMANKTFHDKVASLKGGVEFLVAVGFVRETKENGEFLSFPQALFDIEHITLARDCLVSTERIAVKVYRNAKITKLSETDSLPIDDDLPVEFFQRTVQEVASEQRAMTENVEKITTLRTREMRERDESKSRTRFHYAIVRIRFPDDWILQGLFNSSERLSNVYDFVQHYIDAAFAPFTLRVATGKPFDVDQTAMSLAELQLSPSCVLLFQLDESVVQNALATDRPLPSSFIRPEFISSKD
uniref:UBX domain-containing protein n=1 Tax=Trichuris muris TaxID=70415 RepID=A0A5S6R2C5_TRIMR